MQETTFSLTSVLGKNIVIIILGGIERYLKNTTIMRHSQYKFTRGKSCLNNFISLYDMVTHLVDVGEAVDVIFLDFNKAFILSLTASFPTSCPAVEFII